MSQHDHVIDSASGAAVRADINNALLAIASLNSGSSAPSTTYAYMLWADTTNGVLKRRNAANSGWIVERTLDETFVLSRSSNTMLDVSDKGKVVRATAGYTQTFDAVATLGDSWFVGLRVESGATLVLDPNSTETIDGATTKSIVGPASGFIFCNGSALYTVGLVQGISQGTSVASTSGTSIDFTGLPDDVNRITLTLSGVSTNGTSGLLVQIGDSGGIENTSYDAVGGYTGVSTGATVYTTGFGLPLSSASNLVSGAVVLTRQTGNTWIAHGDVQPGNTSAFVYNLAGTKTLSATLDRVRLTTVGGADTFDAGTVNIHWER